MGRGQMSASKMVKCLRKMENEERLLRQKMITLENRRLRGDMIETQTLLNGKECIDCSVFQMTIGSHNLRRLFATRNKRDLSRYFYNQRVVKRELSFTACDRSTFT